MGNQVTVVWYKDVESITSGEKKGMHYAQLLGDNSRILVLFKSKEIRDRFKFIPDAPICFTSALKGKGLGSIPDAVVRTFSEFNKRVDDAQLSRTLFTALGERPLPARGRRRPRIRGIEQVTVRPPTFVITCKNPEEVHFTYKRYLSNKIRDAFGFKGSPLKMLYRNRD